MRLFSIITLAMVLLIGASAGAMDAGKIGVVESVVQNDKIIVPIEFNNKLDMTALDLPLEFSEGVTLTNVSFEGTRSEDFDLRIAKIDNENHNVVIGLIPMVYGEKPNLPAGEGVIANLEFTIDDPNVESIELTPTTMESPNHQLMFVYLDKGNLVDLEPEFEGISVALSQAVNDNSLMPTEFALMQNAPNPFNPTTQISYDLPQATNVRLTVFNVLGQNVKTLVNDFQEAGTRSVIWNGTDNSGSSVASGLYFYRIEADNFQATKKMMMLK
jgi:hypothetical protein